MLRKSAAQLARKSARFKVDKDIVHEMYLSCNWYYLVQSKLSISNKHNTKQLRRPPVVPLQGL